MTSRNTNKLNDTSSIRNSSIRNSSMISVPSIITISMGHSNSYLIVSGGRGILVDGGTAQKITNIQTALEKNKLNFSDIVLIVLTHTHSDHVGSLAEIKEKSSAKVLVHAAEKGYLERGITPFPRGTMWFSKIISGIGKTLLVSKSKYTPVYPDIIIKGEYDLDKFIPGARIIPTPGHTDGSISLVIKNEAAFVGDALFNIIPGTVFPPFANNIPELLKSWEKLIAIGCRTFYPGHGKPIPLQKLKDSYEKFQAS
ncbi:MAG: hydroxyacylglutathione hydrolase [Euryarchaeota archaeon]|nr:hydroxyacylglutathione hydrolase [Euryarchaeota archaeon]